MVQSSFGPGLDLAKTLSDLRTRVQKLETRDTLQNASIGAGGLTVYDNGSINIVGTGQFNTNGAISTAASFSAGTSISAGTDLSVGGNIFANSGNISGAGLISTGTASIAGTLSVGTVSSSGQVISAGIVNSPGTKANTVTVGYSAVYIDSSGNMGGNTSSRRFKTNLAPAVFDLDAFLKLTPYQFQRKTDVLEMGAGAAPWQSGLMAEDVAPVAPLNVWYDENNLVEGVRYEELVVPLLMALQREHNSRVEYEAATDAKIAKLAAAAGVTV